MIPDLVRAFLLESSGEELAEVLSLLNQRHPNTLAGAVATLLATDEDEWPEPLTAGEFLSEVGELPPPLIEGLLPDRSLILMTAKPKYCKSLLALDIAHELALGHQVMGLPTSRVGPVLYFSMEDSPYETANRMLSRGIRQDDPVPLRILAKRIPITQPQHAARLEQMIVEMQPVLVIIDTAREALGIRDWFDATEVSSKLRVLREIARRHCTILMLHHNRKMAGEQGDEIAGSNAMTSSVDGWVSIYQKERQKGGDIRLKCSMEGRGGIGGKMTLHLDHTNIHFSVVNDEEEEQQQAEAPFEPDERQQLVLNQIAALQRASTRTIQDTLGLSYDQARRAINALMIHGRIVDSGDRTGPNNNIILWRIPEPPNIPEEVAPEEITEEQIEAHLALYPEDEEPQDNEGATDPDEIEQ